ncbi:MAG: CAP domain-containing protein [Pseudomonadota bacterium]
MKATIVAACTAIACFLATADPASACSRSVSSKAAGTAVPSKSIDQRLLERAIVAEVNFHRCRAGLPGVATASGGLRVEAVKHSSWMAKYQQLTHRSTVSGSATLKQRFRNAGVRYSAGSENIGMVHRYRIDNRRFNIIDANACKFASKDGTRLPVHSYASLARHIVNLWMNSPGHRKNILDRKVSHMTSGVAFDPKARYCGRFWITQNFIG